MAKKNRNRARVDSSVNSQLSNQESKGVESIDSAPTVLTVATGSSNRSLIGPIKAILLV